MTPICRSWAAISPGEVNDEKGLAVVEVLEVDREEFVEKIAPVDEKTDADEVEAGCWPPIAWG